MKNDLYYQFLYLNDFYVFSNSVVNLPFAYSNFPIKNLISLFI